MTYKNKIDYFAITFYYQKSCEMESIDFTTINDDHSRKMMENAFNAITATEGGWDYLRTFAEETFMYSRNPIVQTISDNMVKLGYDGHSGASFGWTMRTMEYLAKHGKEAFLAKFAKTT